MAEPSIVHAAARNNAEWCHLLCRTHGITGHFDADMWTSRQRTPLFYPDAVTLQEGVVAASLLERIDESEGSSVKDSFADLDLVEDGFRILFRGEWLVAEPEDAAQTPSRWRVVGTAEELAAWGRAWSAPDPPTDLFQPALLANSALAVLALDDGEEIVAGAILNRSPTVIGLSNVFHAQGDLESVWREAACAARARWGPMPVVGYDSGADLEAAHRAGFDSVGELAVWLKGAL